MLNTHWLVTVERLCYCMVFELSSLCSLFLADGMAEPATREMSLELAALT